MIQRVHRFPVVPGSVPLMGAAQSGAQVVTPPTGWTWTLPFTITRTPTGFSVGSFDLQTYSGITVAKTYYVKTDGNDGDTGLDEAHAFADLGVAMNKADCDRVMIKAGTYNTTKGWDNTSPARSMQVIGYGGDVILTQRATDLIWSAVDNHYEASFATNIGCVVDFKALDADGDGIPLTYADAVATVDATPGTWWYDGTADVIYVRTLDSRAPDANISCNIGAASGNMNDAVTYYVEGIRFESGTRGFLANTASADAKLYMKNCTFKYTSYTAVTDAMSVTGLGEVILQGCVAARNSGDGFKMAASGAQAANLALINCIGRYNGLPASTNANGYSRHGPGNTVCVNTEFHHNYGPQQRDITGSLTWVLGGYNHDPAAAGVSINYSVGDTGTMWLDTCISEDALVADIQADAAGGTVYYHNMTPASPTTTGAGTFAVY